MMRTLFSCLISALLVGGAGQGQIARPPVSSTAPATPEKKAEAITGQCHCGHLKYEISGPIIKCSYCDCRGCRRATGTLKAPFVTVSWKDFKVIGGDAAQFRAAAGEKCDAAGGWYSCPKCRSPLYWKAHHEKSNAMIDFASFIDQARRLPDTVQ